MPTKKSTPRTKKAAPKRATTRKVSKRQSMQSFRLSKESRPFRTAKFTDDTLHWIIIGAVILFFSFWIASLNITINDLYNEIQVLQAGE